MLKGVLTIQDAHTAMDAGIRAGYGEFRTDYEPILACIMLARCCGPNGGSTCTVIVDHGNPGAWHSTSASAPATTVPCTTDMEVLDGILGALDTHEFVFAQLMGLANAMCTFHSWPLILALGQSGPIDSSSPTGLAPEAPENTKNSSNDAIAENTDPADPDTSWSPPSQSLLEKNVLFEAVTSLDAQLTTLHAALPPCTVFLLFLGHSDPCTMSALAAWHAEFQVSLNQSQSRKQNGGIAAVATIAGMTTIAMGNVNVVRWTMADDRTLRGSQACVDWLIVCQGEGMSP